MDFMPLRLNYSSLTCSICALAAIILQFTAMEFPKLHMVDSPINLDDPKLPKSGSLEKQGYVFKFVYLHKFYQYLVL